MNIIDRFVFKRDNVRKVWSTDLCVCARMTYGQRCTPLEITITVTPNTNIK